MRRSIVGMFCAVGVLASVFPAIASAAARLKVCPSGCPYSTVQDAVNAAPDGATSSVASGTYAGFSVPGSNGNLTSIRLRGAGAGQTTLNGSPTGDYYSPAVSVDPNIAMTISDVTITTAGGGGGVSNAGTLT